MTTSRTNPLILIGFVTSLGFACSSNSDDSSITTGGKSGTGATAGKGGTKGGGGGSSGTGATSGGTSGVGGGDGGSGGGSAGAGAGGTSGTAGSGAGGSSGAPFRFISWADTKSGTSDLSKLSDQALPLAPAFTIYEGDLVSSWSDGLMDTWVQAVNGQLSGDTTSNKMFEKTFPVRGNHEGSGTGFASYMAAHHPDDATAQAVGATNFTNMPGHTNVVYSFDFGNSHFIGLDCLGDAYNLPADQIQWADQELAAAETRGLTHAFLFFHGPIYCVDGHCCTTSGSAGICDNGGVIADLIAVINKHPIVTASFHGHEHVLAITQLTTQRDPLFTHPFYQFHTADAGAGPSPCSPERVDWCLSAHGFATVDVSGKTVTVNYYKEDSTASQKQQIINKP